MAKCIGFFGAFIEGNKLSYAFFGFSNKDDHGPFPTWQHDPSYYCGPVKIPQEEIRTHAMKLNAEDFGNWLRAHKPKEYFDLGHVNNYDLEKFERMLKKSGFQKVEASEHQRSKAVALRGLKFDTRPGISLYVEGYKQ